MSSSGIGINNPFDYCYYFALGLCSFITHPDWKSSQWDSALLRPKHNLWESNCTTLSKTEIWFHLRWVMGDLHSWDLGPSTEAIKAKSPLIDSEHSNMRVSFVLISLILWANRRAETDECTLRGNERGKFLLSGHKSECTVRACGGDWGPYDSCSDS